MRGNLSDELRSCYSTQDTWDCSSALTNERSVSESVSVFLLLYTKALNLAVKVAAFYTYSVGGFRYIITKPGKVVEDKLTFKLVFGIL